MRVFFLALFSAVIVLTSCNCNSPQTPLPVAPLEARQLESVPEREHRRQLMAYFSERTVAVIRDCSPKKGVTFFDVDNPRRFRGSGVIVQSRPNRSYIYTSEHVVLPKKKHRKHFTCKIYINRNENVGKKSTRIEAEILSEDGDRDVAILKVKENLEISTEIEQDPYVGEPVWAVGYPRQLVAPRLEKLSVTEGSLATLKVPASGNVSSTGYYHRVTTQIYFGNSGGGIWTVEGKLVGIAAAMYLYEGEVPYEGYYYIKPAEEYGKVLKEDWKYWEVFDE